MPAIDGTAPPLIGKAVPATAWLFGSHDVEVEYVEYLPPIDRFTRPAGDVGLACLLRNRRARDEATALAKPQWHPIGPSTVAVAEDRLLVAVDGEWVSLWFDDDFTLFATARQDQLCAATATEGPYLLEGPAMPYIDGPYLLEGPAMPYIDGLLAQVVDAEPVEPMPTAESAWTPLPAEPPSTCGRRGVTVGRRGRWSLAGWRT